MDWMKAEYVCIAQEDPRVVHWVLAGDVQLLFISPESIRNNKHSDVCFCPSITVAVAVDEAYCVHSRYVANTQFCILTSLVM